VLWRGASAGRLATAYVLLGLIAGIVVFVSGLFYKIVPLLAWTARYSGRTSTPGTPTVAQMFSARVAEAQLAVMVTAMIILSLSILLGATVAAYIGAGLFMIGVLLFASQIGHVALGRPAGGVAS
jgi:hypothetical protein